MADDAFLEEQQQARVRLNTLLEVLGREPMPALEELPVPVPAPTTPSDAHEPYKVLYEREAAKNAELRALNEALVMALAHAGLTEIQKKRKREE